MAATASAWTDWAETSTLGLGGAVPSDWSAWVETATLGPSDTAPSDWSAWMETATLGHGTLTPSEWSEWVEAATASPVAARRFDGEQWVGLGTPHRFDGENWIPLLSKPGEDIEPEVLSPTISELTAPVIVAHRAGGFMFPENTMFAAEKALADPNMGVEVDLQLTSDGKIALSHDATVDRTAADGQTGAVASYTAAAFQGIRQVWPEGSTWEPKVDVYASLWDELADTYGGKRILIAEGKATTAGNSVVDDIVDRQIQSRTLFISFSQAQCAYAEGKGVRSILVYSGASPDFSIAQATGCWGVCVYTGAASQEQIADANSRGLKVFVLQVTNVTQMNTYLSRGAFGFISDEPWILAQSD